jgi:single-strand DNA-binding protein
MRNLNLVVLNGRLGKDPELKKTNSGKSVVSVNLAVAWDKETTWVPIVAWERLADALDKYTSKGSLIGVEGRLSIREWEDKDGVKKTRTEVVATNIQLLDSRKDSNKEQPKEQSRHEEQKKNGYQKQDYANDDIPF